MQKKHWYLSLRFKLLVGYSLLFTLSFVSIYWWFYQSATQSATDHIAENLKLLLAGTVKLIDGDTFEALARDGVTRPDGYSDDPRYWEHVALLYDVHELDERAYLYTYIKGTQPNQVIFIGSHGALLTPPDGAKFKEAFTKMFRPETIMNSFTETTLLLDIYTDPWGSWVSGYTPIYNSQGKVVGGLGIDYRAEYIKALQASIQKKLLVNAAGLYGLSVLLVTLFASQVTAPLRRLSRVSRQIGKGEFSKDLSPLPQSTFSDEITDLAENFAIMVDRVYDREQSLHQQVAELQMAMEERIQTHLNRAELVDLFENRLIPTLQICESALLLLITEHDFAVFEQVGVEAAQLPSNEQLLERIKGSKGYEVFGPSQESDLPPWIRLVIPLRAAGKPLGIWLIGERCNNAEFTAEDLTVLRTFSTQLAVSLLNIQQAELLHALYTSSIATQDRERNALAREIHDDVLSKIALLSFNIDAKESPKLASLCQQISESLRQAIYQLRPPMMNYGLKPAISGWMDELSEWSGENIETQVDIAGDPVRYLAEIEEHVFRIIQQATENAARHAQATYVRVSGKLEATCIYLVVSDDGQGFDSTISHDLSNLLLKGHFGLVGMYERSQLIGARLWIQSSKGEGTKVFIHWGPEAQGTSEA